MFVFNHRLENIQYDTANETERKRNIFSVLKNAFEEDLAVLGAIYYLVWSSYHRQNPLFEYMIGYLIVQFYTTTTKEGWLDKKWFISQQIHI